MEINPVRIDLRDDALESQFSFFVIPAPYQVRGKLQPESSLEV